MNVRADLKDVTKCLDEYTGAAEQAIRVMHNWAERKVRMCVFLIYVIYLCTCIHVFVYVYIHIYI